MILVNLSLIQSWLTQLFTFAEQVDLDCICEKCKDTRVPICEKCKEENSPICDKCKEERGPCCKRMNISRCDGD